MICTHCHHSCCGGSIYKILISQFITQKHLDLCPTLTHANTHSHTHTQSKHTQMQMWIYCHSLRSSCEFSGLVSCVTSFIQVKEKKKNWVYDTHLYTTVQLGVSDILFRRGLDQGHCTLVQLWERSLWLKVFVTKLPNQLVQQSRIR